MKVLDTDFAQSFIRMCNDGWMFGWHESNGGNASYRLRPEEVSEVRTGFRTRPWVHIDTEVPILAGEFFLITAAGSHFRSIAHDPKSTLGIIEVDRTGTCWRECWGFKDGTHPTSELVSHLINHEVRKAATQGDDRVIYHCHPANLAAMTCVVPHDSAVFTRTLWAQLAECALVCREGIEVISWEVPGSVDLAIESAKAMEHTGIVVWPHHGLFVSAATMDEAFGIAHTVEKSAEIFCKARACGMPSVSQIADEELVNFSREYDLGLSRRNVYAKPCLGEHPAPAHAAKSHAHGHPAHAAVTHIPGTFRFPSSEDEPASAPPADAEPVFADIPDAGQPLQTGQAIGSVAEAPVGAPVLVHEMQPALVPEEPPHADAVPAVQAVPSDALPDQGVPAQVVGEVSSQVIPSSGAPGDQPLHVPSLPKLPGPELSPEEQEKLPSMLPRLDQVAPQPEGAPISGPTAAAFSQAPMQTDAAADGLMAATPFPAMAPEPMFAQQLPPTPHADASVSPFSEGFPPPPSEASYPPPFGEQPQQVGYASAFPMQPGQPAFPMHPQAEPPSSPVVAEPEQLAPPARPEQLIVQEADETVRRFYPKPPKYKA